MKKIVLTIIIYLSSFQMAFGRVIFEIASYRRAPASTQSQVPFDQLWTQLGEFKRSLIGYEDDSHCLKPGQERSEDPLEDYKIESVSENISKLEEGQVQSADSYSESSIQDLMAQKPIDSNMSTDIKEEDSFYEYLADLEKNACSMYTFKWDDKKPAEEAIEECEPKKIDGFFDKKVAEILDMESNKEAIPAFSLENEDIRLYHKTALKLRDHTRILLMDDDLAIENRRNLLIGYITAVLMPMRDIVVGLKSYARNDYDGTHFYDSLLIEFPEELFPEDEEGLVRYVQLGPSPSTDPFFLDIDRSLWGKAKLKFLKEDITNNILRRDIITLLKAPTAKNYAIALRWMSMLMGLEQMVQYDIMLGSDGVVETPKSCRDQFNGNLPEKVISHYPKEKGEELLNQILIKNKLFFISDSDVYSGADVDFDALDMYSDNNQRDPLKVGFSSLLPFQEYKAAKVSLDQGWLKNMSSKLYQDMRPDIDDGTFFESIIEMKKPEIDEVFKKTNMTTVGNGIDHLIEKTGWGGFDDKVGTYEGKTLVEKIIQRPMGTDIYEFLDTEGKTVKINASYMNISKYIAESMQRNKVTSYKDLITPELEKKLKANIIKIKFPSIYGDADFRQWAFDKMYEWILKSENEQYSKITSSLIIKSCGVKKNDICDSKNPKKIIANAKSFLEKVNKNNEFIPASFFDQEENFNNFKFLKRMWESLRNWSDEIPESKISEYDLLIQQVDSFNPWARLRLSYLIAKEELTAFENGQQLSYLKKPLAQPDFEVQECFYKDISDILNKVEKAAKILGLNQSFNLFTGNRILNNNEKKQLWKQKIEVEGHNLFKLKDDKDIEYFSYIENISNSTLLTKESVDDLVTSLPKGELRTESAELIDSMSESNRGKLSLSLFKLYKEKGDVDKQQEVLEDIISEHGLEEIEDIKREFVTTDLAYKRLVYMSLLRDAIEKRREKLEKQVDRLCSFDINTHEEMQAVFFSIGKNQNALNELSGAPSIPQEKLAKIEKTLSKMSREEYKEIMISMGAIALMMGSLFLGGHCMGMSLGVLAPLCSSIVFAGVGAVGVQSNLVRREVTRYKNYSKFKKFNDVMVELDFAEEGSHKSFKHGWGFAAFEAFSILPLMGVAVRSATMGSKYFIEIASTFSKNITKVGVRKTFAEMGRTGKIIASETDTAFARVVLGYDSQGEQFTRIFKNIADSSAQGLNAVLDTAKKSIDPKEWNTSMKEVKKLYFLWKEGKISTKTLSTRVAQISIGTKTDGKAIAYKSDVFVGTSAKEIDKQTAKVVSNYVGHDAKQMHYIMRSYAKKVDKLVLLNKKIVDKKTITNYIWSVPGTKWIGNAFNGIRKWRIGPLVKYGEEIKRINKELIEISERGGNLENYIFKNMDTFTDIFVDISIRKREIPYMVLLQGGPHIGGVVKGQRIPYIYGLADGIMLRKFFTARSRLVYESYKAQAKSILGLSASVSADNLDEAIRAFQESYSKSLVDAPKDNIKELEEGYANFKKMITQSIVEGTPSLKNKSKWKQFRNIVKGENKTRLEFMEKMDDVVEVERILFAPVGIEEKFMSKVIWNSVNIDQTFGLQEIGEFAYKVVKKLSNYKNIDEFQKYVNALKIIIIKRNPGTVEVI